MVPLWRTSFFEIARLLRELVPLWRDFTLATSGRYLGFILGPGVSDASSWQKAFRVYGTRCAYMRGLGLSFTCNMWLYEVLALSFLQFVAQLQPLPSDAARRERRALDRVSAGPGHWIPPAALHLSLIHI